MSRSKVAVLAPALFLLVAGTPTSSFARTGDGATVDGTRLVPARQVCDNDGRCFETRGFGNRDDDDDRPPPRRRFDPDDDDRGPPPRRRYDPDDDDRPPPPPRRRYHRDDDD